MSREADAIAAHAAARLLPAQTGPAHPQVPPAAAEHCQALRPIADARLHGHHRGPVGHDGHRSPHQRHEAKARTRRQSPGGAESFGPTANWWSRARSACTEPRRHATFSCWIACCSSSSERRTALWATKFTSWYVHSDASAQCQLAGQLWSRIFWPDST